MSASTASPTPAVEQEEFLSRSRLIRRRFFRNKSAVFGLGMLISIFAIAFIGPSFAQYEYDEIDFMVVEQYGQLLTPPNFENGHYFGTTNVGGDVYAQTLRGVQKSLIIGLLVAFFSTAIASIVGATAGYLAGKTDRILMWVVDLLLVLPSFLIIAIASRYFQGGSWWILVILLAAFNWMITARIVRGVSTSLRQRDFIRAAHYMGVPTWKIIWKHMLPNMSSLLIIDGTLSVGGAILAETGLSYLGFGVRPPDVSLGTLIEAGTSAALTYPWLFMFAGAFLIATVLSISLIGDGLRDAFDPGSTGGNRS